MKNRIVSALARISAGSFETLESELTELVYGEHITTHTHRQQYREQVRVNARLALTNILHSYTEFSVSTIDSFFQRILRNFAKELKLPMRYEIEMDTAYALEEIMVHLLQDVGHDKELTQWLENFTFAQLDEDKGWDITPNITRLGMELFKDEIWQNLIMQANDNTLSAQENTHTANANHHTQTPAPDDQPEATAAANQRYRWLKELVNQLWQKKRSFEQQINHFVQQAQSLIAGYGLTATDFKAGTFSFFTKLTEKNYAVQGASLLKILDGNTEEWRAKTSAKKEKIDQLVNQGGLQTLLLETIDFIRKELPFYQSATEVIKNIYAYGILHNLKDKLKDYRTEKNLMLISDTNNLLQAVIAADGDTPFVFEKVGAVYKHLLIDEFQDTANFQWQNLKPLVFNALGSGNAVLVVGDVKQSIYRWRGGNLNLLLQGLKDDLSAFFSAHTEQELKDNYRSAEHIVTFNNHFFAEATRLMANTLFTTNPNAQKQLLRAYATVQQGIKRHTNGYVQVNFFANDNNDPESGKWKQQAMEAMLHTIQDLEAQKCSLKNIAVLVRTNTEGADIAQFLTRNEVKVVSSESLLLKNSVKVQLLIAVLHYLANPNNAIAQAEMLLNYLAVHHPHFDINHAVFAHRHYTEQDANNPFTQILPPQLLQDAPQLIKKPLYETIETLLQILNLCQPPDAYIQRFQDLILDFSRTNSADILHFLEWWQENKERDKTSIIVPEGENAVTIMTIHKAKGLEFPVVITPFAEWDMKPGKDLILWAASNHEPFNQMGVVPVKFSSALQNTHFAYLYHKELLHSYMDNLNLLYVAFTRPTEELYVCTKFAAKPNADEVDGIYKLLFSTLSQFPLTQHFDPDAGVFAYGERVNWEKFAHHTTPCSITPLNQYLSHHYEPKITLRTDSKRYFTLFDHATAEPLKLGQKIHSVLERVVQPADVDKVIRKLQIQGLLTAADEKPIKHRINQIFQLPQVQNWFSPHWEVMAERTILIDQKNHRPDRVLLHQNQAVVIDYKTGDQKPQHLKQVNAYAYFLTQMGYEVAGKYLLYIAELGAEVVELP